MFHKIINFSIIITLIKITQTQDFCNQFKDKESCLSANPVESSKLPLYQGRCCFKDVSCIYIEKPIISFIDYNGYSCGTQIEKCYYTQLNNIFDKYTCNSIPVEKPYKCCYIKFDYHASCFPVDISNKKVFKLLENHLKPYYGFFEPGKIEIYCLSNYIMFKYIFLIFILFIFL